MADHCAARGNCPASAGGRSLGLRRCRVRGLHGEELMKSLKASALVAALTVSASAFSFAATAKDLTVGVSWSNFQEERWKTDEAAIKKALEAHGGKYISADAQGSPTKQLA